MKPVINKDSKTSDPNYSIDKSKIKDIPKEFWKTVTIEGEDVDVYLVDGDFIAAFVYIDFTLGGHHYVDKQYGEMIPTGIIFIDEMLSKYGREAILVHETEEYRLMHYKGWTYEKAHVAANRVEQDYRKKTYDSRYANNEIEKYHKQMFKDEEKIQVQR